MNECMNAKELLNRVNLNKNSQFSLNVNQTSPRDLMITELI